MIDNPHHGKDNRFETNEQNRTLYEQELVDAATPRLTTLQEQYETGNYRSALTTLTDDTRLDIGLSLSVFRTLQNNHPVIVRIPRFENQREDILNRASALALGLGTDGLEQPLAMSLEDQAIFSSPLNGKQSDHLQEEEILAIPEPHLRQVALMFKETHRGLGFDLSASNIFYDPQHGFSFTDYALLTHPDESFPERNFATFLYKLGYQQHSYFLTDSQQQAWQSLISDPMHLVTAIYPEAAADIFEQVVYEHEE